MVTLDSMLDNAEVLAMRIEAVADAFYDYGNGSEELLLAEQLLEDILFTINRDTAKYIELVNRINVDSRSQYYG